MNKPKLTENDFKIAAKRLNCGVAEIKAVAEIESSGEAFYTDGFPTLLFERHKFHFFTKGRFDKDYPEISSAKAGGYGRAGTNQRRKFNLAFSLDKIAAMKSCSWGKFQIMGFNFLACGFDSVGKFVDAMKESEAAQLHAFVGFVINNNLAGYLRNHNWATFARGYNGAGYKKNNYDVKLANAYRKFSKSQVSTANDGLANPSYPRVVSSTNTVENSAPEPIGDGADNPMQTAENIVNIEGDKSPDEKAIDIAATAEPVTIIAPEPADFLSKLWKTIGGIFAGTVALPAFLQNGLDFNAAFSTILLIVQNNFKYILATSVGGLAVWLVTKKINNFHITKLKAEINTDVSRKDVRFI